MEHIFGIDNPVWNFIGKIMDMLLLTVLWTVTSIPIITIGASTTALYSQSLKLAEDKEGYLVRSYFQAFKENFKQSTICWLIMLAIGAILAGDVYICYQAQMPVAKAMLVAFLVLSAVYVMVFTYLFPVLARCDTSIKNAFFLSFMIALKQFGWTVLMVVITGCVLAVAFFVQWLFLVIAAGLIAFLHALILKNIFKSYQLEI